MGMDLSTSVLPWYIPLKVVLWGEGGYYGERMRVRKARGEESAIFKMVRESQGPRPGHALLEYLSGRMTDPSSAPSLTSVAYLLIHC